MIQAAVTTRVDNELLDKSHIIVDRYVFELLDTSDSAPLAFRHVHRSESREITSSIDLTYGIKAVAEQSGHILIDINRSNYDENPFANLLQTNQDHVVPPESSGSTTASISQVVQQRSEPVSIYTIGMDEDGDIFCAPLACEYEEEETEVIMDNCSGILVRLVFNNRFVRVDTHGLE